MEEQEVYSVLGGIKATEQQASDCIDWLSDNRGALFFKELKESQDSYEEQLRIENVLKGQDLDAFYRNRDINVARFNLIKYIFTIKDRLISEIREIQDERKSQLSVP